MPIDMTNSVKLMNMVRVMYDPVTLVEVRAIRSVLDEQWNRLGIVLSDLEKQGIVHDIFSANTQSTFDRIAVLRYEHAYDAYKSLRTKVLKHAMSLVVKPNLISIALTFVVFAVILCGLQLLAEHTVDYIITGLVAPLFFVAILCLNPFKQLLAYFRFKWESNNPDVRVGIDVMDAYTRGVYPDYDGLRELRILVHNLYLEFQTINTTRTKES